MKKLIVALGLILVGGCVAAKPWAKPDLILRCFYSEPGSVTFGGPCMDSLPKGVCGGYYARRFEYEWEDAANGSRELVAKDVKGYYCFPGTEQGK
jgi:hypothetical protein